MFDSDMSDSYIAKNISTVTCTNVTQHHICTVTVLVKLCNGTELHTVTVDYPMTWLGNTITVEIFLAVYLS